MGKITEGLNKQPPVTKAIIAASEGFDKKLRAADAAVDNVKLSKATLKTAASNTGDRLKSEATTKAINKVIDLAGGKDTYLGKVLTNIDKELRPEAQRIEGFSGAIDKQGHYAKMAARPDPALSFRWQIVLPMLSPNLFDPTININDYVEEVSLATSYHQPYSVYRAGNMDYFANYQDVSSISVTFYEDRLFTATTYVNAWKRMIYNPSTKVFGVPYGPNESGYKKVVRVLALDEYNQKVGEFLCTGVFPLQPQSLGFQSQSSDRLRPSLELQVTDVLFIPEKGINAHQADQVRNGTTIADEKGGSTTKHPAFEINPIKATSKALDFITGKSNALSEGVSKAKDRLAKIKI